ncbi:MAG TPA: hypothetical protein VLW85_12460 [Myxococcales bacterium]|nr:hypothetical protein [Myxococcales bacterium]
MRLWPLALLLACTPAAERRPVDPQALRGVTLGLPVPADARDTPGIGCGQVISDLSLRAHKALIASFGEAGANATNASTGPWVLTVALREATMGPENERARPTDRPLATGLPSPDQPPPQQPQQSWLNSGQGQVAVVLDATLARNGAIVWRETVTGHASSAPCVQAVDKVREALQDAADKLRERVVPLIRQQ